ncbi:MULTISPECIES: ABC transporter permease [unclassified Blastococcus]
MTTVAGPTGSPRRPLVSHVVGSTGLRRPSADAWRTAGITVACVAVAVGLAALLVTIADGSPSEVVDALYTGSIADAAGWSQTLVNAAPLLLVALGACIANRAGVFNIGQEGQLLIGAMVGCFVALRLQGPGWLVITVALVAAAAGGGVWSGISAAMYYTRGVNVVVTTLLLTFIAAQVVQFAVLSPSLLQETGIGNGPARPQSDAVPEYLRLASFGEYPDLTIGVGVILAVVATVVLAVLLGRSRWGFRLNMLGFNPLAARHAGIRASRLGGSALVLSGAFAGLAGGVILMGTVFRLQPAISNNFGWDGLLVALVARSRPGLALPVAVLFGGLRAGSSYLAATGVPDYLVDVIQALLVLAFVVPPVLSAMWGRRIRNRSALPTPPARPSAAAPAKEEVPV